MVPALLFLSLPAYGDDAVPFCDTAVGGDFCATKEIGAFLACAEDQPCIVVDTGKMDGENIQVVTPHDTPEGYREQIIIME